MLIGAHDHITDIEELRVAMLAEIARRDVELAQRDVELARRDAELARRDSELAVRDATLSQLGTAVAERDERIARLDDIVTKRDQVIESLEASIARLTKLKFGMKSERFDPAQASLFEAAIDEEIAASESALEELKEALAPKTARPERRQPKRQPLPEHLPRVEQRIEPASCDCDICGGALHTIGEEVSEKLDVKPAEYFVRRIIRPKLACRVCETVQTPPALPSIIDGGIPAPGLLAQVMVHKYADHLPLTRQREMVQRSGVDLPVSTLSSWVGATGFALEPLVALLRQELRTEKVVHADETPVQMLAPGNGKTKTAYLFAYRRGEIEEPPIIVYDYAENRSGKHVRSFLDGYGGALVVDDYAGYKAFFKEGAVREIACWAHARRKFFELHAANKSPVAAEALARIATLYDIEAEARSMDAPARHALRQARSRPAVDSLFQWLESLRLKVNSGSGTAKAMDYLLRRKPAFTAFLEDGCFPIDNNPVENAIRPIAVGRKNWLFTGSLEAGQRAANIMSLIQTAKANGHDPMAYLADVLERLPSQTQGTLHELLPHVWKPKT